MPDPYSPVSELNQLKQFQDRLCLDYAGEFWLHSSFGDSSHLGGYEEVPEFRENLIPFAQANSSGSFLALWRRDDRADLATLPVIYCDDDGVIFVAASTLRDLLRLITLDHEVFSRAPSWRSGQETPGHQEYVTWLASTFGLTRAESPTPLFNAAKREHGRAFADWWMGVEADDSLIEDMLDELADMEDFAVAYVASGPERVQRVLTDEVLTKIATEHLPTVTFHVTPLGRVVKLSAVHNGVEPGSIAEELAGDDWLDLLDHVKDAAESG